MDRFNSHDLGGANNRSMTVANRFITIGRTFSIDFIKNVLRRVASKIRDGFPTQNTMVPIGNIKEGVDDDDSGIDG